MGNKMRKRSRAQWMASQEDKDLWLKMPSCLRSPCSTRELPTEGGDRDRKPSRSVSRHVVFAQAASLHPPITLPSVTVSPFPPGLWVVYHSLSHLLHGFVYLHLIAIRSAFILLVHIGPVFAIHLFTPQFIPFTFSANSQLTFIMSNFAGLFQMLLI